MNRELMTIKEVSDYLQVPVGTLYHWRMRGYGPAGRRMGKHIHYRAEDVAEWIEQQKDA